jgi:type VI secretion system protein ImpA
MVDPLDGAALAPISSEEACGPDLDLAGDAAFMNFLATWEGKLPQSFFIGDKAFDRASIDFPAAFSEASRLLVRTHDIRLLALLAKLAILDRDLAGFARYVRSIAWLLTNRWDEVHPRAEGEDFSSRIAQLASLDDGPVVVMPMQYVPLLATQREGALVFRARMVARGEAKPREGEGLASSATMDRIMTNVPMEALAATTATIEQIQAALGAIQAVTRARLGFVGGVEFKALAPLVGRIAEFLREVSIKRDPSLAAAPSETTADAESPGARADGAPSAPAGFATLADIDAALSAALGYFAQSEPSSPARLLIGHARESLGKNLYEVMQLLAPSHADNARVFVGPDGAFTVPVNSLTNASSAEFDRVDAPPASSRAAALAIIETVASHIRRTEPSSPAPYLLERARALASRDFLTLLQDLLPEDDLSSMKQGR